jgi:hypothetical protein
MELLVKRELTEECQHVEHAHRTYKCIADLLENYQVKLENSDWDRM